MALYQVQAQVVSTRGNQPCSVGAPTFYVGAPTFYVDASSAEEATTKAHLVLLCDHRDSDARKVELHGTVIRDHDREDYLAFAYRSPDGK